MHAKHRRGPWSSAEDNYLLELVRTQGASNWVRISTLIQSRSPKQCRERYHQNLKSTLNLDPITPEEGLMIERMVAEIGKRWAEIARRLHGRSDNAVKNWWNGGMNRRKRRDNRRAEMAQHSNSSARAVPQASNLHQPATVARPVYEQMYSAPQYHYDAHPASTHVHGPPQAYPPPSRQVQPTRPAIEPPLPSPSAASYVSRSDASESSAAPSLVSDTSISSSYSQSPGARYASHELPSPTDQRDSYGRPVGPAPYPQPTPFEPLSVRDSNVTLLSNHPPKEPFGYHTQYLPPVGEIQKERPPLSKTPPARPAQPQLQLPSIQTLAPARPKVSEPLSPPRDQRMNVNALIH